VLEPDFEDAPRGERRTLLLQALPPVSFDQALDEQEQVGPDGLRAEVAAPDAPSDGIEPDQDQRRQDQEAREVVDLLRPDFDEEEVKAPAFEVEEHGLLGLPGTAGPADERQDVIDGQAGDQRNPLQATVPARNGLGNDSLRHNPALWLVQMGAFGLEADVESGHRALQGCWRHRGIIAAAAQGP
jgi:hypothetical protein